MKTILKPFLGLIMMTTMISSSQAAPADLIEPLQETAAKLSQSFDQIEPERRESLQQFANQLAERLNSGKTLPLTFICTHNSRRSHLSQIWCGTAAAYYGVAGVEVFSGGTEATACNSRTVGALRRAGFAVVNSQPKSKNPIYWVQFAERQEPLKAFSKKYGDPANPAQGFIAVMTCSHADQNCPVVEGSELRVALPYVDPKVSDGTLAETATYDARCEQIGREMLYLMSLVKALTQDPS